VAVGVWVAVDALGAPDAPRQVPQDSPQVQWLWQCGCWQLAVAVGTGSGGLTVAISRASNGVIWSVIG
jgi:hypothetical protein